VAIFFLAFLPQFADPVAGNLPAQLFLLGVVFIGVALVVFIAIACLAGFIAAWLKGSARAQILLNRLAGLVFTALALRLAMATR
jgi:threonine/homoserine/homoserine lactone efflux protein